MRSFGIGLVHIWSDETPIDYLPKIERITFPLEGNDTEIARQTMSLPPHTCNTPFLITVNATLIKTTMTPLFLPLLKSYYKVHVNILNRRFIYYSLFSNINIDSAKEI